MFLNLILNVKIKFEKVINNSGSYELENYSVTESKIFEFQHKLDMTVSKNSNLFISGINFLKTAIAKLIGI